ncbi:hypothetical protein HUU05_17345 [candidate division KSB1 bacterium]|nr:hypothetical protein [candidate division KSB1 bacterium]
MKVKPFVWMLMLLSSRVIVAQDYNLGARAQALGGSGVACATDPEGQFINPAALTQVPGQAVTLFYSRPFGIREITLSSVAASAAFGKMSLGGAVTHLAQAQFDDQSYQFTLAAKVSLPTKRRTAAKHFLLGVQGAWRRIRIAGYETAHSGRMNAGLVVPITQQLAWGAALGNLMGASREQQPRSLALGLHYRPSARFAGQFDLYKQGGFAQEIRSGIELVLFSPLLLRAGMATNPDRFTLGLAFALQPVTLHFTTFSHFDLGWTQQYAATLRH